MNETSKPRYTNERNAQIVIALLKAHGIHRVVANPGTTNIAFVGSVQNDPWFNVYSGVDERHSAYLACGMAAESGEPVVLSCTGATASRNYIPALTEAYYRKLPILALTSMRLFDNLGNLLPQMLDRSVPLKDMVRFSLQCPVPHTTQEEKSCESNVNKAILELTRHGGGPVLINLETENGEVFGTSELPPCRVIHRITPFSKKWPEIGRSKKILVWVGSHRPFSPSETKALESFVKLHNAVVAVDQTSGYGGKYAVHTALVGSQPRLVASRPELDADLVIHIGEISGDYPSFGVVSRASEFWRVNIDGEARDLFQKLTNVFEMPESFFFEHYASGGKDESAGVSHYLADWEATDMEVRGKFPEVPFSNFWIANVLCGKLPSDAVIHFGILNSLRSWNLQRLPDGVRSSSNVGGFGIDGGMSSLIGASLVHPDRPYYLVIGDLAFFYDLNSLGNRHIGKNVRILLVNNGCGAEFNLYSHPGSQFGEQTNDYIAAGRHNGNCSRELVKHYAQDLGFKYLAASSKDEFNECLAEFVAPELETSIVFECFTTPQDESDACRMIDHIIETKPSLGSAVKNSIKAALPQRVKNAVKELIR